MASVSHRSAYSASVGTLEAGAGANTVASPSASRARILIAASSAAWRSPTLLAFRRPWWSMNSHQTLEPFRFSRTFTPWAFPPVGAGSLHGDAEGDAT